MAKTKISESDLGGFGLLDPLRKFVDRLHGAATERDRAGNRQLFFDQYVLLLLLYYFNPIVDSLRGLQQTTELAKVRRAVGGRFSLGSLSEASRVFDADLLQEILREVGEQAKPILPGAGSLALRRLTAVDGSLLQAMPKMAWALWQDAQHRAAKMHVAYDVFRCIPINARLTAANDSEKTQLRSMIEPDRLYVLDRGYAEYQLLQEIVDARASFLVRLHHHAAYRVVQERPISAEAAAAGVLADLVVDKLGSSHHKNVLRQPVRIVLVATGKTNPDGTPEVLVLCTNRLDLEAELVALGYRYRWQVELFFRWLKCILGCRHLLSTSQNGVAIQVYVALIASLLLALRTGRKPTKRTYEMLCHYFMGLATEAELLEHLEKHQR